VDPQKQDSEVLITIDDAVVLIRKVLGPPIPKSRIHKDLAAGIAPRPDAIYGRRYLWRPERILAYARTLIKPHSECDSDNWLSLGDAAKPVVQKASREHEIRTPRLRRKRSRRSSRDTVL